MHLTKLVDARSSKACSAWHTGQGCLNDCFYFVMQEFFKHSNVVVFLEKGGNFNCQKDFKQEHCSVQNFNMSKVQRKERKEKKVQRKEKVCFRHLSCILKVHSNRS